MAQTSQCTGNCMGCTIMQRQYCASQIAYNNMRMMEDVFADIEKMMTSIGELKAKIEAIQNNEGTLINPLDSEE